MRNSEQIGIRKTAITVNFRSIELKIGEDFFSRNGTIFLPALHEIQMFLNKLISDASDCDYTNDTLQRVRSQQCYFRFFFFLFVPSDVSLTRHLIC